MKSILLYMGIILAGIALGVGIARIAYSPDFEGEFTCGLINGYPCISR